MKPAVRRNNEAPSASVQSWEVVERESTKSPPKRLRISVTYESGLVRLLHPSFADREALDKYVARFHPDYIAKERQRLESSPAADSA
jgi:hypothetical protein